MRKIFFWGADVGEPYRDLIDGLVGDRGWVFDDRKVVVHLRGGGTLTFHRAAVARVGRWLLVATEAMGYHHFDTDEVERWEVVLPEGEKA